MNKRDIRLDFIRAIAMLIIVIYHWSCALINLNAEFEILPLHDYANGSWGGTFAIVFFVLSGHVQMLSDGENKNFSVKSFYKKRFLRLYPMYWIAYIVVFTVHAFRHGTIFWAGSPWLMWQSVIGIDGCLRKFYHNYYAVGEWFFGIMVILYVIFPITRYLFLHKFKWTNIGILIVVGFLSLSGWIEYTTCSNLIYCFISFWFGMCICKYKDKVKSFPAAVISGVMCLLLYFVGLTNYVHSIYLMHLTAFASFVLLLNVPIEKIRITLVEQGILFLSKYSFPVMFVHHTFIYGVLMVCIKLGIPESKMLIPTLVVVYVLAYILEQVTNFVVKIVSGRKK